MRRAKEGLTLSQGPGWSLKWEDGLQLGQLLPWSSLLQSVLAWLSSPLSVTCLLWALPGLVLPFPCSVLEETKLCRESLEPQIPGKSSQ